MFEKIASTAEKLATGVGESRRAFLGQVGRAGAIALGVVAGLLGLPATAFCDVDCGNGRRCRDGHGCCFTRAGVFDGCCPNNTPHTCRSSSRCYATLADAQRACGNDPVYLCGGPR